MLRAVLDAPQQVLKKGRESRQLVLVVVFVALLLDNMLLTVVGTSWGLCAEGLSALDPSRQHTPYSTLSMGRLENCSYGKHVDGAGS
jgi:hypothetical protein